MKQRLLRNSVWCAVLTLAAASAWGQEAAVDVEAPVTQRVPSVTEDEKLAEPDYATVAADARHAIRSRVGSWTTSPRCSHEPA